MKFSQLFSALAVVGVLASATVANAEDKAAEAVSATEATSEDTAASSAPTAVKLQDGTQVEVNGDDVSIIGADGAKTPAPDGTHTLEDGSTITTKDGKKVSG